MIALESQPELLADARCDPTRLSCLGIALGQSADALPRERIVDVTFSPLVKTHSTSIGRPPEYDGFGGKAVTLDAAWASVIFADGVLHTDRDLSFTVLRGRVARISLYGRWLAPWVNLNTPAKLHRRFGRPDRCYLLEADGDLLGYDSYYDQAKKWVRWLTANARPSAIMIGANGNVLREHRSGGVSRELHVDR